MKRKPTGFVATCQCDVTVGAIDAQRTDSKDMGRIIGKWLRDGCTVAPFFNGTWSVSIQSCKCDTEQENKQP